MKLAICGLGYVGAVTAGCLVRDGHEVWGVEVQDWKANLLRSGKSPVVEAGLDDLIAEGIRSKKLKITGSIAEALDDSDVLFICVGTPSRADGGLDTSAVERVCQEVGAAIWSRTRPLRVILRSTVLPGTTRNKILPLLVKASGKIQGNDLTVSFLPEFLREGTGIHDFDHPPYTLVGEADPGQADALKPLFASIQAPFLTATLEEAEMLKYACNAFHATKITFANEIGALCKSQGLDGRRVMEFLAKDTRLNASAAYLKPGFAFGGSCLPKDLRALMAFGTEARTETPLLASLLPSQVLQVERGLRLIDPFRGKALGLWGVSFKGGTDDLRESPALRLFVRLREEGLSAIAYDPNVIPSRIAGANLAYLEAKAPPLKEVLHETLDEFLAAAEVLIVSGHADGLAACGERLKEKVVVDLSGAADGLRERCAEYVGLSWP